LGYNELKTLEVHDLIQALGGQVSSGTDFAEAMEVERLATAIRIAAKEMRWVSVSDI
jgi:predicted dehydrogenase